MKFFQRNPVAVFGVVLAWRVLLLVFTAQPIPANDAFGYDGPVVNLLHGGRYCNPSMAIIFPIAGTEVFAMYPPLYEGVLLAWMKLLGTSVIAAMALHLTLFALAGFLTLGMVRKFFPAATGCALAALLFFGLTFGDRPESLAYVFGLAALWLTARQVSAERFSAGAAAGLTLALWLTLYTSVIVGAYFFGVCFLTCATMWLWRRKLYWFAPFVAAAALFAVITLCIAKFEQRWWAGFMESARQQSVMGGFHLPGGLDLFRLVRTAPVFLVALAALPWVVARRKIIFAGEPAWVALTAGIFAMGWLLLAADMTLLASSYVGYVMFTQIVLAVGLLALAQKFFPERERLLLAALVGCVLLVSVRAIGLSTWGVACAWKNSYAGTQATLRVELKPFTATSQPVLLSSAFLYGAADLGVKNPIHADWYFDHAHWSNNTQFQALARLQPPKIILTQFDYYRSFAGVVQQLREQPELVDVRVRDLAAVRPPDAIPSLQRVLQHVSWAPVIVDLNWKQPR